MGTCLSLARILRKMEEGRKGRRTLQRTVVLGWGEKGKKAGKKRLGRICMIEEGREGRIVHVVKENAWGEETLTREGLGVRKRSREDGSVLPMPCIGKEEGEWGRPFRSSSYFCFYRGS